MKEYFLYVNGAIRGDCHLMYDDWTKNKVNLQITIFMSHVVNERKIMLLK